MIIASLAEPICIPAFPAHEISIIASQNKCCNLFLISRLYYYSQIAKIMDYYYCAGRHLFCHKVYFVNFLYRRELITIPNVCVTKKNRMLNSYQYSEKSYVLQRDELQFVSTTN
jgi:hypothetical protein